MDENGNPGLPDERARQFEQGLALYHRTIAERDTLRNELRMAKEEIAKIKIEVEALYHNQNLVESRMRSSQLERDQAVGERAKYEALFVSVQSLLRAFKVPTQPLVKEVTHEADADIEEAIIDARSNRADYYDKQLSDLVASVSRIGVSDETRS